KKTWPECRIFSGAGTGTHDIDTRIPELTELQAGSYTVMDAEYLAIGSAENPTRFDAFHPALTILTTVVSTNQKGFVTVDAGLKAIYRDGANPIVLSPSQGGMVYDWFGDEYGKISFAQEVDVSPLGSVLELIVSHCDPTINLFDRFYVAQNGKVIDVWEIDLRGRSQ
ncbi:MAG: DSD1 family PLP-dependent enzyme, partial [Deltaproteobacteria bacterium]|nr:DSD1 family PLP-dependent enzyme [Deltaproteobacteria bacterium]